MRQLTVCLFALALLAGALPLQAGTYTVRLGSRRVIPGVSAEQIAALREQPGVAFHAAYPRPERNRYAVAVPADLGGGYLVGTRADIAGAFNAVGITVGLNEAALSVAVHGGRIALASLVGIIAATLSGPTAPVPMVTADVPTAGVVPLELVSGDAPDADAPAARGARFTLNDQGDPPFPPVHHHPAPSHHPAVSHHPVVSHH